MPAKGQQKYSNINDQFPLRVSDPPLYLYIYTHFIQLQAENINDHVQQAHYHRELHLSTSMAQVLRAREQVSRSFVELRNLVENCDKVIQGIIKDMELSNNMQQRLQRHLGVSSTLNFTQNADDLHFGETFFSHATLVNTGAKLFLGQCLRQRMAELHKLRGEQAALSSDYQSQEQPPAFVHLNNHDPNAPNEDNSNSDVSDEEDMADNGNWDARDEFDEVPEGPPNFRPLGLGFISVPPDEVLLTPFLTS